MEQVAGPHWIVEPCRPMTDGILEPSEGGCGKIAGISRARVRSVVTNATGVSRQGIQFNSHLERRGWLVIPRS